MFTLLRAILYARLAAVAWIALLLQGSLHAADTNRPLTFVDVFVSGQEGYPTYRIPALLTGARGTLLAFAEARARLHDHAENDLVLKRSRDQGATWGPLQIVAEDGTNSLNNPTAVLARETGRILLLYQRYAAGFDEHTAAPGLDGPRVCRTFLTTSDDEGATWTKPREITAMVKRPTGVTSMACGPGIGIQLQHGAHAGRLLIPINQGPYGRWKVYAAFSDDQGETWRYGETAPDPPTGCGNEVQFAELPDGSVLLNARHQGGARTRLGALSQDGGATWCELREEPSLLDPPCQAALLRHPDPAAPLADLLVFSHPASAGARTNGTIRLSRDQGRTWPIRRVLYPGSFAYSSLTSVNARTIGCLFERDNYRRITFTRLSVEWVEEGERTR